MERPNAERVTLSLDSEQAELLIKAIDVFSWNSSVWNGDDSTLHPGLPLLFQIRKELEDGLDNLDVGDL